jgi:hypothetical protein
MLNAEPVPIEPHSTEEVSVQRVARSGAIGAVALAGVSTLIVMAIWFAFYLFVFVPRAGAP